METQIYAVKIVDTKQDSGKKSENEEGNKIWMEINGGYIHILAGGDGIDSNGDLTINGGEIYIDGPSDNGNSAIDYGDWSDAYVNGGTLVAIGSSGMAEEVSDADRVDASHNSKTGGFGIGLSVVYAIVIAHKGKISAKSEDGKSVTFTVVL